nr:MAG TPA: hypothetical protein [Caudoviricetes sp.]
MRGTRVARPRTRSGTRAVSSSGRTAPSRSPRRSSVGSRTRLRSSRPSPSATGPSRHPMRSPARPG